MAPPLRTEGGLTYTDYQADLPESMRNEKRALLAQMAEFGTEGTAEYIKSQKEAQGLRANSIEAAAARGATIHAPNALNAKLTQDSDALMAGLNSNLVQGNLGHGREMDRIAAANAAYLDSVSAASKLNQNANAGLGGGGGRGGGGGGRGGGGGGVGGGGGGETGIVTFDPKMTLEEAGLMAGTFGEEDGGDIRSGIDQLFGNEAKDGTLEQGGNKTAQALHNSLEQMRLEGATREDMMDELRLQLEDNDTNLDQYQKDLAFAALVNKFGLAGNEQVGIGEYTAFTEAGSEVDQFGYNEQGHNERYAGNMAEVNRYTAAGRDLASEREAMRFANRAAADRGQAGETDKKKEARLAKEIESALRQSAKMTAAVRQEEARLKDMRAQHDDMRPERATNRQELNRANALTGRGGAPANVVAESLRRAKAEMSSAAYKRAVAVAAEKTKKDRIKAASRNKRNPKPTVRRAGRGGVQR